MDGTLVDSIIDSDGGDDVAHAHAYGNSYDHAETFAPINVLDTGSKRLSIDRKLCGSAIICLVLMVIENSLVWYMGSTMVLVETWNGTMRVPRDDYNLWMFYTVHIIKGVIAALTIFSVILLSKYYSLLLKDKRTEWSRDLLRYHTCFQDVVHSQAQNKKKRNSYSFLHSSLSTKYAAEVLVHMLYPYAWLSATSLTFYHFLQIGMFMRLYLLFRFLHTSSPAFKKRFNISRFYEEFRRMNWQVKWRLSLKILFYEHSIQMVLIFVGLTMFIGSFAVFLSERKSKASDGTYPFAALQDCVWFTFVTFTTIGYGDMVPHTLMGRVLTFGIAVVGQIMLAIFGGVVTNKLAPSKQQQLIQSYLKTDTGERGYTEAAAVLIQSVWRAGRPSHQYNASGLRGVLGGFSEPMRLHKQNKIYAAVKRFKAKRSKLVQAQLQAGDPVVDQKLDRLAGDVAGLHAMMAEVLQRLDTDKPSPVPHNNLRVNSGLGNATGASSLKKLSSRNNLHSPLSRKWSNRKLSNALPTSDLAQFASSGGTPSDSSLKVKQLQPLPKAVTTPEKPKGQVSFAASGGRNGSGSANGSGGSNVPPAAKSLLTFGVHEGDDTELLTRSPLPSSLLSPLTPPSTESRNSYDRLGGNSGGNASSIITPTNLLAPAFPASHPLLSASGSATIQESDL